MGEPRQRHRTSRGTAMSLLATIALLVPVVLATPAFAVTPSVYPPDASPLGMTYSEWEGSYMSWMLEIPRGRNPITHPDSPKNCGLVDGMVFLGAAGANCDVPTGTPVAFTLEYGFWECSTAEGLGETYRQLRRCATGRFWRDINPSSYQQRVLIDGVELTKNRRWIFLTPGEMVDFPKNNIWHVAPGPSKSVTKGFFFILEPLDAGLHTIRVRARDVVLGKFLYVFKLHVS